MAGNSIEGLGGFINGIHSKIGGGQRFEKDKESINIGKPDCPPCPELPSLDEVAYSADMFDEILNEGDNSKVSAYSSSSKTQSPETRDKSRQALYMLQNLDGENEAKILDAILTETKNADEFNSNTEITLNDNSDGELHKILTKANSGEYDSYEAIDELVSKFGSIENVIGAFQDMSHSKAYADDANEMIYVLTSVLNGEDARGVAENAPEKVNIKDEELAQIFRDMKGTQLDDHGEVDIMLELIDGHENKNWDPSKYKTPDTPPLNPDILKENLTGMQHELISDAPDPQKVQDFVDVLKSYEISELTEMYKQLDPISLTTLMPAFIQLTWDGSIDLGADYKL